MGEICICHVAKPKTSDHVIQFSSLSWETVICAARAWIFLDGLEQEAAKEVLSWAEPVVYNEERLIHAGYHRLCYQRFTDKQRIERAKKRILKLSATIYDISNEAYANLAQSVKSCVPSKVAMDDFGDTLGKCVFCNEIKRYYHHLSGKRLMGKLVCADTGKTLYAAASEKKDTRLLECLRTHHMSNEAINYHASCYKSYVRTATDVHERKTIYSDAFKEFCSEVIDSRIISGKEIIHMNTLRKFFMKYARITDASEYRNSSLKVKLQRQYGTQLDFVQPHPHKCELVMSAEASDRGNQQMQISKCTDKPLPVIKSKQRSFQPPQASNLSYYGKKRHGPALAGHAQDWVLKANKPVQEDPARIDLAFWMSKSVQTLVKPEKTMMGGGVVCCLLSCPCCQQRSHELTFHRLPKPGTVWLQQMLAIINRTDEKFYPERAYICSRHFEPDCFEPFSRGRTLREGSLPTKFLTETVTDMSAPEPTDALTSDTATALKSQDGAVTPPFSSGQHSPDEHCQYGADLSIPVSGTENEDPERATPKSPVSNTDIARMESGRWMQMDAGHDPEERILTDADKLLIRKKQQNIRSRRYRERQRQRQIQEREWCAAIALDGPTPVQTWQRQEDSVPYHVPTKTQSTPVERINYVRRYSDRPQQTKSFWAPSLDDKTKYMMRANSLVVGFVWETDKHGEIYLSGTKVIRSEPKSISAVRPKRIYTQEMLRKFIFKVEPAERTDTAAARADTIPADYHQKDEEEGLKKKPIKDDRIQQIIDRLRGKKHLTSTRYALYRYFILRCSSAFHVYHCNVRRLESNKSTNGAEAGVCAVKKRKPITRCSLRITRARFSRLTRLRTRLKVCGRAGWESREQQILDMIIPSDEQDSDISSDMQEHVPVLSTRGQNQTRTHAGTDWKLSLPHRKLLTLPNLSGSESSDSDEVHRAEQALTAGDGRRHGKGTKMLKVKRLRKKLRAEQEQWGYDDASDTEQMMQRSHMRERRYQYLKAGKQSKLQHTHTIPASSESLMAIDSVAKCSPAVIDPLADIATTSCVFDSPEVTELAYSDIAEPQIIRVESLEDDAVQALSWEVAGASDDADASDFFMNHQFGF